MSTQTKQIVLWMLRMPHNFWMLEKSSAGAVHQRSALHLRVPTLMISIFCKRVRQHAASVTKK